MIRNARWLLLAAAFAATTAVAGARDSLDDFTHGLKGLQGRFTQQVYDANGRLKESSSGRVALSAPRLFRWEYVKPYEQLIVADGEKVWVYDPDLSQVTVRPQGAQEQESPLAALIDPARLDRDYVVAETGSRDGLQWLQLTPKQAGDASFQRARLGFDAGGLVKMQVVDALGQRTELVFGEWSRNPEFEKGTFSYVPAAGVDVVGEG